MDVSYYYDIMFRMYDNLRFAKRMALGLVTGASLATGIVGCGEQTRISQTECTSIATDENLVPLRQGRRGTRVVMVTQNCADEMNRSGGNSFLGLGGAALGLATLIAYDVRGKRNIQS